MEDFASLHWSNFIRWQGQECNRSSVGSDEFHLKRCAAGMAVHNGSDIALLQTCCGNVFCQNDSIEFSDHGKISQTTTEMQLQAWAGCRWLQ
ncbi:MAG TPA: hypothetical protein VGH74_06965 [Planctomycetaceae bacterium]